MAALINKYFKISMYNTIFMQDFQSQDHLSNQPLDNTLPIANTLQLGDDLIEVASLTQFQDHIDVFRISMSLVKPNEALRVHFMAFQQNLFFNEGLMKLVELLIDISILLEFVFGRFVWWHKTSFPHSRWFKPRRSLQRNLCQSCEFCDSQWDSFSSDQL